MENKNKPTGESSAKKMTTTKQDKIDELLSKHDIYIKQGKTGLAEKALKNIKRLDN